MGVQDQLRGGDSLAGEKHCRRQLAGTRSVGRKKREKGSKKLAGFLRSFRPRECSMKMKEGRRNRNQGTNVAPLAVGFAFVARTMMESGVCERSGMRFSYLLSLIFVRQSHGYRWVDTAPLAGEGVGHAGLTSSLAIFLPNIFLSEQQIAIRGLKSSCSPGAKSWCFRRCGTGRSVNKFALRYSREFASIRGFKITLLGSRMRGNDAG